MRNRLLLSICLLLAIVPAAWAVEMPLSDPEQEAEAYALFHQIRCAICMGQTIADSPADIAADLRRDIREHIAAGDSPRQVKIYLSERYGDAILMRPPLTAKTAVLWFGPVVLLIIAILVIWIGIKRESAKSK
jgi:cytochrome c-type biogenesis protein CcmH